MEDFDRYFFRFFSYFSYNCVVILTFFFISLFSLILNYFTKGKSNDLIFCSYRSSLLNPFTYVRFFTHIFGHSDWSHFRHNFLTILLIGPMVEEKFGSINLIIMIGITAFLTGVINSLLNKNTAILGASGIAFMMIILSSFVNIQSGKIPVTLVLIFIFYIVDEIKDGLFKKDNVSHLGHLMGAICGCVYGFYILW